MEEKLLFNEEREIKRIRESTNKRNLADLNRKNLTAEEMDEIFCEF